MKSGKNATENHLSGASFWNCGLHLFSTDPNCSDGPSFTDSIQHLEKQELQKPNVIAGYLKTSLMQISTCFLLIGNDLDSWHNRINEKIGGWNENNGCCPRFLQQAVPCLFSPPFPFSPSPSLPAYACVPFSRRTSNCKQENVPTLANLNSTSLALKEFCRAFILASNSFRASACSPKAWNNSAESECKGI